MGFVHTFYMEYFNYGITVVLKIVYKLSCDAVELLKRKHIGFGYMLTLSEASIVFNKKCCVHVIHKSIQLFQY